MTYRRSLVGAIICLPLMVSLAWSQVTGPSPALKLRSSVVDPVVEATGFDAGKVVLLRPGIGTVTVTNIGDASFSVTSLLSDNESFRATIEGGVPFVIKPGEVAKVTITFLPTSEGVASGTLTILTNDPGHTPPTVPLTGIGVTPHLDLAVATDFGQVLRGRCRDSAVVVTNTSSEATRITGIRLEEQGEINFFVVDAPDLPFDLPAGASFTVVLRSCPTSLTSRNTGVLTIEQENGEHVSSNLGGRARGPFAAFNQFGGYNVGEILLGVCRDTVVWLINGESVDLVLDTVALDRRWGSGGARILSPTSYPRTIGSNDSIPVHIEYCPSEEEKDGWWLQADFRSGSARRVNFLGSGVQPRLWIDSAALVAGDVGNITLRVRPAMALDGTAGEIELFLNPNALWIESVSTSDSSGEDIEFEIERHRSGRVLISSPAPLSADSSGRFIRISVRGLITGEPVNSIEIRRIGFGDPNIGWDRLAGQVLLSGCDIGNFSGAGRSIAIQSIRPNPGSSDKTTLVYRAPEGYSPTLRLYNTKGNVVLEQQLHPGSGEIEELPLDLTGVSSGYYLLELTDREERRVRILRVE